MLGGGQVNSCFRVSDVFSYGSYGVQGGNSNEIMSDGLISEKE